MTRSVAHLHPVAAVACLSLALVALAAAPPLTAAPAAVTGLASSSHPNSTRWYAKRHVVVHWQPAADAAGYSWWLDRYATTVPDTVAELGGLDLAGKSDFATGASCDGIAIGDFNGDGREDLATADHDGGTVDVLLGDGSGGFGAVSHIATGDYPNGVAAGDLNGDGRQDLVTADSSASIGVLLGDGSGGFGTATHFEAAKSYPVSVAVGDLNGDGRLDAVTANPYDNSVSVLLGDGSGGFAPRTDFATGARPRSVVVADVNNDGRQDVVTANEDADSVSVLLGDGSGGFGPKQDFATGTAPTGVAVGDLNGDARLDLVAPDYDDDTLSVLLGDGSGSFAPRTTVASSGSPSGVAIADVNGDGRLDLATVSWLDDVVGIHLGDGGGGFSARHEFVGERWTGQIATGDLNGDGRPDLLAANVYAGTVSVLVNRTPDAAVIVGPRADGVWYFHVRAIDDAGAGGATRTVAARIDTRRPVTRATRAVTVVRGARATLRYRVDDARPGSPTATVRIKIVNRHGKTVKTLRLGAKAVNRSLRCQFRCTLGRGSYRYRVYATDQAGNVQSKVGSNRLRVR